MTRNRLITLAVAVAAAGALAGCGSEPAPTGVTPTVVMSQPTLAECSAVFVPGEPIDQEKAAAGCLDPNGGIQGVGAHPCSDGRSLWQVDASTGAPEGWGFSGAEFVAGSSASDGYAAAYEECLGS